MVMVKHNLNSQIKLLSRQLVVIFRLLMQGEKERKWPQHNVNMKYQVGTIDQAYLSYSFARDKQGCK